MFLCQACLETSPPGSSAHRHITYRQVPTHKVVDGKTRPSSRQEIAREDLVCASCAEHLARGIPFADLRRRKEQIAAKKNGDVEPVVPQIKSISESLGKSLLTVPARK